jgi:hypothetical protein
MKSGSGNMAENKVVGRRKLVPASLIYFCGWSIFILVLFIVLPYPIFFSHFERIWIFLIVWAAGISIANSKKIYLIFLRLLLAVVLISIVLPDMAITYIKANNSYVHPVKVGIYVNDKFAGEHEISANSSFNIPMSNIFDSNFGMKSRIRYRYSINKNKTEGDILLQKPDSGRVIGFLKMQPH